MLRAHQPRWSGPSTLGRTVTAIAVCLAISAGESAARAAGDEPSSTVADRHHPPTPKRAVPDYDGRGNPEAQPGEPGLWPLRMLLSPLYLTSEVLLRKPLGALTIAAERADLPRKAYDFFVFVPDHKGGIVPVGFVEFGLNPSVGLYGFWNDAFYVKGNDLRVHYEVWPDDWLSGTLTDRWRFHDDRDTLQIRAVGVHRPDDPFYGIGPESRQSDESRYSEARFEAHASFEARIWRRSRVLVAAGVRKVDVTSGEYRSDPSVEARAATGAFSIPFGFDRSYSGPTGRLEASLDTRRFGAKTGSGVRLTAQGYVGSDVSHAPASAWMRYGAVASGFLDVNGHGRILELSAGTLFADPLTSEPIPFTELVALGDEVWMTGYLPGRLLGRSAAVASLQYHWPIAPYLDASLVATVGNVFGPHLEGFDPKLLRFSGGIGLRTTTDPPIEVIVGLGTDTFDHGATIQSGRVSFGVPLLF